MAPPIKRQRLQGKIVRNNNELVQKPPLWKATNSHSPITPDKIKFGAGRPYNFSPLRVYKGVLVTKSELIDDIALQTPEIQRRDVELVVNTILQTMTDALSSGQRIEIRGFGSFVPKLRRSRSARNPRTGEEVMVPQKYVPFFSVGKELRERINRGPTRESLYGEEKSPWGA